MQRILDDLVAHYYQTYPREAVGVVLNDGSTIRFHNYARQSDRYRVITLKLIWLLGWKAWRHGKGIAAIYHSHRKSTRPSQIDKAFMGMQSRIWHDVGHLIFTPDRDYQLWVV